jgi:DNA-directed RNA polymerase subunit K/omega
MSARALIHRLLAAAARRALARELGAPTGPVPKKNVIDATTKP